MKTTTTIIVTVCLAFTFGMIGAYTVLALDNSKNTESGDQPDEPEVIEETVLDSGTTKDVKWKVTENKEGRITLTLYGEGQSSGYDEWGPPWYNYKTTINRIVIEDGVTRVGKNSFKEYSVTELKLGNTLVSIGSAAFYKTQITNLELPDSLISIEAFAFAYCPLESITYGTGLKTIGGCSFANTTLKTLDLPDSLTAIDEFAFGNSSLETVTIGSNVNSIDRWSFSNCTQMKTFTFSKSVNVLGEAILQKCSSLETIYLPVGSKFTTLDSFGENLTATIVWI